MQSFKRYPLELLHWYWGNHIITPVLVKWPWKTCVNWTHGFIRNSWFEHKKSATNSVLISWDILHTKATWVVKKQISPLQSIVWSTVYLNSQQIHQKTYKTYRFCTNDADVEPMQWSIMRYSHYKIKCENVMLLMAHYISFAGLSLHLMVGIVQRYICRVLGTLIRGDQQQCQRSWFKSPWG